MRTHTEPESRPMYCLRVYLPLDKGYAMCSVQLTSPDQKAQFAKICKSMKKI